MLRPNLGGHLWGEAYLQVHLMEQLWQVLHMGSSDGIKSPPKHSSPLREELGPRWSFLLPSLLPFLGEIIENQKKTNTGQGSQKPSVGEKSRIVGFQIFCQKQTCLNSADSFSHHLMSVALWGILQLWEKLDLEFEEAAASCKSSNPLPQSSCQKAFLRQTKHKTFLDA